MHQADTANAPSSESSFLAGFGLGLLAGAAGFILFGTKRGISFRRQLQQAVREASNEQLLTVTDQPATTLREFLVQAFNRVKEELEKDTRQRLESEAEVIARRQKQLRAKSAAKTKFKNAS